MTIKVVQIWEVSLVSFFELRRLNENPLSLKYFKQAISLCCFHTIQWYKDGWIKVCFQVVLSPRRAWAAFRPIGWFTIERDSSRNSNFLVQFVDQPVSRTEFSKFSGLGSNPGSTFSLLPLSGDSGTPKDYWELGIKHRIKRPMLLLVHEHVDPILVLRRWHWKPTYFTWKRVVYVWSVWFGMIIRLAGYYRIYQRLNYNVFSI